MDDGKARGEPRVSHFLESKDEVRDVADSFSRILGPNPSFLSTRVSWTTTEPSTSHLNNQHLWPTIDTETCCSTAAVALWAMEAVPVAPTLELTIDTVLEGGVGPIICDNPPWSPERRDIRGQSNMNGRA